MDYKLYYWDLPFRGVFIEMLLAEAGATYSRHHASDIYPQRSMKITNPGIAPPYLYECRSKTYFAQMPAILMHLAREYDLLPKRAETHTLALKTILDCNDVLMEITNCNGQVMWEQDEWDAFRYGRLPDWMHTFESTGLAHGFKSDGGYLLGSTLSVADIATTALFGPMVYSFPALAPDLQDNAPHIARLVQRVEGRAAIRELLDQRRAEWERGYCGGQIEASLRAMIEG